MRKSFLLLLTITWLCAVANTLPDKNNKAQSALASLWRIAPPAPTIPETERLAELASRRAEVMKRVGENGMLILFSAEPGDHFRQENNLYYLTGINQEGVTLALVPSGKKTREILFLPRANPMMEVWNGHMVTPDEARARSGVQEVWDATWLNVFLAFLCPQETPKVQTRGATPQMETTALAEWKENFQTLTEAISKKEGEFYLLTTGTETRSPRREQEFAAQVNPQTNGLTVKNAAPIFAELRLRKSAWEQRLIQYAVDITSEAFQRAFALALPGVYEYQIQAEFEYTFRRRQARWGYPCIVGGGVNATTLHYQTNADPLPKYGLLLMDCGGEYDHYTCDVTRTMPVSGKFTKEQAEIYRIVYEAQLEAIKLCRPGNLVMGRPGGQPAGATVHGRAVEVVKEGLLRLGLITSKDNNEYARWFMHGTSHWLGMDVHDVGSMATPLAPGMVLTVEPGIYIRPNALDVLPKTPENEKFIAAVRPAFEKYKGIGVRIEDDVVVTEGDPKILSAAIPSRLEDVEATIARLRREVSRTGVVGERMNR